MKDLVFWFTVFLAFSLLLSLNDPKAAEKVFNFLFIVLASSWILLNINKKGTKK